MATRTHRDQLTVEHRSALALVVEGADVYDYSTAIKLREIQKLAPEYLDICKAMNPPSGEKRQPYFGAIATRAGKRWIESVALAKLAEGTHNG